MIKKVWVKNYRSLEDVAVELEPITIFVGENGSGKSNMVDVLRFMREAFLLGLDAAMNKRGGMISVRTWSQGDELRDVEMGVTIETDEIEATYSFALGGTLPTQHQVQREICEVHDLVSDTHYGYEVEQGEWKRNTPNTMYSGRAPKSLVLSLLTTDELYQKVYDYLIGFSFYNISPDVLAHPQKIMDPYPLEEDGVNLSSTLHEMKQRNGPYLPTFYKTVKHVFPDVIDLQILKLGSFFVTQLHHQMNGSTPAIFDLAMESDGTRRLLGILVALYQDEPRTLLCLEEPEFAIHPDLIASLWEEIEIYGDRCQILVTTHHPDLLEMCSADQVRVVEKIEGKTFVAPIDRTQRDLITQRLFSVGSLMRSQGLIRDEPEPIH
ncbi:MAG: AAA family ATPase [Chloroflexota bacterium]